MLAFLKSHNMPLPEDLSGTDAPRLLIVDDEPEMRRFLIRAINAHFPEVEIHEAVDGFDAGHKIASLSPTLVILDLRLPGMDGFKVCRTVRADEKLKDVKILAITGIGVEESRREILAAGADAFLPKPFDAVELAEQLKGMLPAPTRRAEAGE